MLIDVDQDQSTGSKWPGQNNQFSFDRIATVWVTGTTGNYSGTIGVSTAQQMMSGNPTGLFKDNITLQIDEAGNAYILLGLKREELDPDDIHFDLIASVGISGEVNDDIPSSGKVSISKWPLTTLEKSAPNLPSIHYQSANRQLNIIGASASHSYAFYDGHGRLLAEGRVMQSLTTVSIPYEFNGLLVVRLVGSGAFVSLKFWVN